MRDLWEAENIFLEPSACACFQGPVKFSESQKIQAYLKQHRLEGQMENAVHIAWATGGSLVPEEVRRAYRETYLEEED